jgi:hypothetical protein
MFDIKDIQPAKDQINWWKSFKFWLWLLVSELQYIGISKSTKEKKIEAIYKTPIEKLRVCLSF